jgi:beta-galactosidase
LACYTEDYYAGKPVIAMNRVGRGKVIYVGTMGDADLAQQVVGLTLKWASLDSLGTAPAGVEIMQRVHNGIRLLFILNHTPEPQQVRLDGNYWDILSDTSKTGDLALDGYGLLILSQQEASAR